MVRSPGAACAPAVRGRGGGSRLSHSSITPAVRLACSAIMPKWSPGTSATVSAPGQEVRQSYGLAHSIIGSLARTSRIGAAIRSMRHGNAT